MEKQVKAGAKKRKRFLGLKIFAFLFLVISVLSIIAITLVLEPRVKLAGFATLDMDKLYKHSGTINILDKNGNDISGYYYQKKSRYTKIEAVPCKTKQAFISIEDKRFYSHNGVDYRGIARAVKSNITSLKNKEGASTITQQLIKLTHLTNEKSYNRKLQEIRLAKALERKCDKEQILEYYLNNLYFGNGLYGIDAAARVYFGKSVKSLSLSESAALAAIINSPANYNPYKHMERLGERKDLVLTLMHDESHITEGEFEAAKAEKISVLSDKTSKNHYFDAVFAELESKISTNRSSAKIQNLTVKTNINTALQKEIDKILSGFNLKEENLLVSVVVLDNKSDGVAALTGHSHLPLHSIKRQSASTLKPFLCYGPALEKGLVLPETPINDTKRSFGDYSPSNYRDKYEGWTNIKKSLSLSSNTCSTKLMEMTGVEYCKNYAEKFGFEFENNDDSLALALGATRNGISLLTIADAYKALANRGIYSKSNFIEVVQTEEGKSLSDSKMSDKKRVMSDINAYFMNQMLAECVSNGTAKLLRGSLDGLCAKTGTAGNSNGNTDAYCIAYTSEYTVAVWIGTTDNSSLHKHTGGGTATLITRAILSKLENPYKDNSHLTRPFGVREVEIDLREYELNHRLVLANNHLPEKFRKTIEVPYSFYMEKAGYYTRPFRV